MRLKDRYLVVVRIISGKNFPLRNGYELVAEAKFNGHVLCIDSVPHNDSPLFEQELAWELDKKCLHQHKIQRSCLKIQFFATNNQSPVKEFVGYILMDLRSITTNQVHKYQPLLHTKYGTKPEVLCGIYLDEDGQEIVSDHPTKDNLVDPKLLKPKLNSSGQSDIPYYQIGPDKLCKNPFILSVTILEANNLTYLIPTDIPISKSGDNSFYFYYNLLNNSIISDKFTDLVNATFTTEKTSANILSNVDILKMYFHNIETLSIYLCCNKHSLGIAHIPINGLLENVDHQFHNPAVLEGTFLFQTPNNSQKHTRFIAEEDEPSIKLSVTLQRVDEFDSKVIGYQKNKNAICRSEENAKPMSSAINVPREMDKVTNIPQRENQTLDFNNSHGDRRHFCYTVELRSIRNLLRADHTKRIYTRYVYPIFGSAAPIMTHPPIEIRRDQEVLLPQGYCAFEFGATLKNLEKKLFNNPLVVEVFERDKLKDSDTCIGLLKIPLNEVLSSSTKSQSKSHSCLKFNGVAEITSNNDNSETVIGHLVYNLILEDFGPMKNETSNMTINETKRERNDNYYADEVEDKRSTMEYQAALELELWKESEEANFMNQLKEREAKTMLSLTEEWKKRDKEREILVKKKLTEYDELERALKTTLINLAERERQLAAGELELQRLRKDLESEVERKTSELRDASRRLEQDCEHQNHMLSSHVEHWKAMACDWQQKYQQTERDFAQYRSRQSNAPETKLQSEINQLQSEKLKLEEALENSLKSKDHYKKQWVRAINEVARLKQKHEKLSKDQIRKQETELDQLKLKYKALESTPTGTSSQIGNLKMELEKLREEAQSNVCTAGPEDNSLLLQEIAGLDDPAAEQVMRLIEERDSLLRTGLYTSHHPVITELDRELRRLMEPLSRCNMSAFAAAT